MNPLWVLVWKHKRERLRRPFHTIWETFSGASLFVILIALNHYIVIGEKYIPPGDDYDDVVEESIDVVYSPNNNLTRTLMLGICKKKLYGIGNTSTIHIRCYGAQDELDVNYILRKYENAFQNVIINIEFKNLNDTGLPDTLKYNIRLWDAQTKAKQVSILADLYRLYDDDYDDVYMSMWPIALRGHNFLRPPRYHLLLDLPTPLQSYQSSRDHGTCNSVEISGVSYPYFERAPHITLLANLQWQLDKAYLERLSGNEIHHYVKLHANSTEPHSIRIKLINSFLKVCMILGPLPYFMYKNSKLVRKKRTGMKGMLTLFGVPNNTMRNSYLLTTTFFGTLYSIVVTLLLKITTSPILPYSNGFLIAVTFLFHFVSIMSLTFITSTLAQNYQHSDSLALLMYIMTFIINILLFRTNFIADYLVCLTIPHAPVFVFWDEVTTLQRNGMGTQFSNMWTSHGSKNTASVFMVWVFFIIHLFLILCLSWYLEAVKPGMYGIAHPWNFLCQRKYWFVVKKKIRKKQVKGVNFHVTAEGQNVQKDNRFFEAQPEDTPIAIKIVGVTKIFRNFNEPDCHAVENVDLEVHKGEITVLLGVNGAGKSTLLSIVTGMFSATHGKVYINGYDNSARLRDLRKDLGYCPQREMTFEYLTVMENIYFFQQLRGDSIASANKHHLIRALDLVDVGDYYTKQLPTGMRRAVQIVCALVGDADVLVLDEPTAGMDSKLRHKVWDLLLALRKYKTVLVSTTVMREADAIGDKIAIINKGSLKCHGSPAFLKSAIGADLKLLLRAAEGTADREEIQQIINDNLPNVQMKVKTDKNHPMGSRILLTLPSDDREHFPKVLDVLEEKMRKLGIIMTDVGISMEQVFLSFIQQDDDAFHYDRESLYNMEKRKKGFKLHMYQLYVLMERAFTFVWFHKYQFILLQVIIPIIAFIVITISSNTSATKSPLTSNDIPNATVLYHPIGYRRLDVFNPLITHYPHVKFVTSNNLQKDFEKITYTIKIGYKMAGDRTDIYCISDPLYKKNTASTAVNIFSNMFMSLHMPYASKDHHITTSIEPLQFKSSQGFKNLYLCFGWAMWVVFLSVVPIAPLILLCVEEYYKGVRFTHLHLSVPPYIIWLGKLIPHMCIYTAIVPTSVTIIAGLLDTDNTFTHADFLLCIFGYLMIFGPAYLIFWYVMSFSMNEDLVITKIYTSSLAFGFVLPLIAYMLYNYYILHENVSHYKAIYVIIWMLSFNPIFVFSEGIYFAVFEARNNAFCKAKLYLCPNFPYDPFVTKAMCCGSKDGTPFSHYNRDTFYKYVLILASGVFYWIILILLQRRIIQNVWSRIVNYMYKAPEKRCTNARVKAEEEFVREQFEECDINYRPWPWSHLFGVGRPPEDVQQPEDREREPTVILGDRMHRVFRLGFGKPTYAVRGISLAVQKGKCLGIFGRNGAGKSTTLGMMSGFLVKTRGRSCVNGFSLRRQRRQYLQRVSWAAADGMDEFLSGYKNLTILAALHGYSRKMSCKMAMSNLTYLGLSTHAHQLFGSYSSGCSHRLAVAKSLISEASAVLLDEPCGSVDPHTRPLIVRAIRLLRDQGAACLIAEESMDWTQIEYICDRLAIIDKGEIVAIGSVEEIRRELTSGYTATLKLKVDEAYSVFTGSLERTCSMGSNVLLPNDKVVLLKREFLESFETSILMDEHIRMLYFHIGDPNRELLYSEMFRKLENLRQKHDVVEDYTLSETTVDEVLSTIDHILHGSGSKHEISKKILSLDTKPNCTSTLTSNQTKQD